MQTRAAVTGLLVLFSLGLVQAQERVKPKAAIGAKAPGEAWAEVPDTFRKMTFPKWPVPTDLARWNASERAATRATLLRCLGELPPRPKSMKVEIVSREQKDGYVLERIRFHNGVDSMVPGIILIPLNLQGRAPVVLALHGHGSSKESVCTDEKHGQYIGPRLARKGYVVAAIDGYFNGERLGRGPAGKLDPTARNQEESLFKLHLWQGRTLWGMMLRDEQCLMDYLETRPEVDRDRMGATGMSMGSTRAWWLAAIDDRVKTVVGVACFTRYEELISHGSLAAHGIYYFVPGLLQHFDTEAIFSLVAPRPMLMLTGDQDVGSPVDGIVTLEKKIGQVYALHGKPSDFRSVVYEKTGHEYLPEMKDEMEKWFERFLAVRK